MRTAAMLFAFLLASSGSMAAGDAQRGARVFQACAACHSLEPERNLTGPSLAGVWGRKAGGLESFVRYSGALKNSGIVWNGKTLDAWAKDPEAVVPGNYMSFPGIKEERARADLLAFLEKASQPGSPLAGKPRALPSLKSAPPDNRVTAIRHCKDSYFVTSAAGKALAYWEFNLRFKTDSSASGPAPNAPVMVGQGMQGDRAQVVFSSPGEIAAFIKEGC
ncbi:MAG: c-type cytochrome [Betaproteobacteria bacterium]|nr:MAG: c-type cytochrome [Betaproteobacteria bacterium]